LDHALPVNLSIKNAPDDVVQELRERAARNHRSLQGELMAIIEEAVMPGHGYRTVDEVLTRARSLNLRQPSEAAEIIRADRDSGHRDQSH
jgi:antitoxin FitA